MPDEQYYIAELMTYEEARAKIRGSVQSHVLETGYSLWQQRDQIFREWNRQSDDVAAEPAA